MIPPYGCFRDRPIPDIIKLAQPLLDDIVAASSPQDRRVFLLSEAAFLGMTINGRIVAEFVRVPLSDMRPMVFPGWANRRSGPLIFWQGLSDWGFVPLIVADRQLKPSVERDRNAGGGNSVWGGTALKGMDYAFPHVHKNKLWQVMIEGTASHAKSWTKQSFKMSWPECVEVTALCLRISPEPPNNFQRRIKSPMTPVMMAAVPVAAPSSTVAAPSSTVIVDDNRRRRRRSVRATSRSRSPAVRRRLRRSEAESSRAAQAEKLQSVGSLNRRRSMMLVR